jgi:putative acetyltransferase
MSMMSIRTATPKDREAIRLVEEHAFGQKAEAGLVDALVANGDAVVELVAEEEGHVVGPSCFRGSTSRRAARIFRPWRWRRWRWSPPITGPALAVR